MLLLSVLASFYWSFLVGVGILWWTDLLPFVVSIRRLDTWHTPSEESEDLTLTLYHYQPKMWTLITWWKDVAYLGKHILTLIKIVNSHTKCIILGSLGLETNLSIHIVVLNEGMAVIGVKIFLFSGSVG